MRLLYTAWAGALCRGRVVLGPDALSPLPALASSLDCPSGSKNQLLSLWPLATLTHVEGPVLLLF